MGKKKKSSALEIVLTIAAFSGLTYNVASLGGFNLFNVSVGGQTDSADITDSIEKTDSSEAETPPMEPPLTEVPSAEPPLSSEIESETNYRQEVSQPVPSIIILQEPVNENTNDIKTNNTPVVSVSNADYNDDDKPISQSANENTKTNQTIERDVNLVEETEQSKNDESSPSVYENVNQTFQAKAGCQLNIDSPSQLVLVSDSKIDQNGSVNISYVNSETEEVMDMGSYELSEVVNADEEISDSQQINYMNMPSGTFIFMFEDCSFDNIDFYLVDFDELPSDNLNTDENKVDDIIVPSQNEYQIKMNQKNPSCRVGIIPSCTFQPLIVFRSEKNMGGMIKMIDDLENELFNIELEQIDGDNTKTITPSFELQEGKQYYLELNSLSDNDLSEYTFYFKMNMLDNEEYID